MGPMVASMDVTAPLAPLHRVRHRGGHVVAECLDSLGLLLQRRFCFFGGLGHGCFRLGLGSFARRLLLDRDFSEFSEWAYTRD
jgi:hypothetical protein